MKRLYLTLSILGASCASLALPERAMAVATTKVALSYTAWTDLGVGPVQVNSGGTQIYYAIADTVPPLPAVGFAVPTNTNQVVNTTSHVWVIAATPNTASVVVAPVAGSGGSGGTFTWPGSAAVATGGLPTAGTMPYVNSYIVGGTAGSSTFTPDNSYSTTLAVTNVSTPGGTALPAAAGSGSVIKIYNRGPATLYYQVGNSSVVAATNNASISPGCWDSVVVKAGQTNIAAVTSVSALTANMNVESGIGGPLASGCNSNNSIFQIAGQGGIGWTNIGGTDNAGTTRPIQATAPGVPATVDLAGIQGGALGVASPVGVDTPTTGNNLYAALNMGSDPTTNSVRTIPASNVATTDCSGTATTGSTTLITSSTTLHGFMIQNLTPSNTIGISFSGAAAIGSAGTYSLFGTTITGPNTFTTPPGMGVNGNVTIIASASSAYSCTKF